MKKLSTLLIVLTAAVLLWWLFSGQAGRKADDEAVTVWHWMTDRHDTFRQLADEYWQQTGVRVKLSLFAPSDTYTKKITAATQAGILPDIYGILDTKQTFSDFIRYGYVADLTADFDADGGAWRDSLYEKALLTNTFAQGNAYGVAPGIYGVPLDVTTIQMLYNRELLTKAGFESPPSTFDEFVRVSAALKRVGVPALVSGWGEVWLINCFAANYAFNIMGEEKVMRTYRGEVPYTDGDWLKVFNLFQTMAGRDMLLVGLITKPNKEAEQDFALGRAAFAFNGSWSVNVYREMNPDLDYGVFVPPPVNPARPMQVWGGAGSSFVVNPHSPRKAEAIAFLKWLTQRPQQEVLARETNNLPSNPEATGAAPAKLEAFARGLASATHPSVWPLNEDPLIQERFGKGLQAIILGKKTPQQVAEEIQALKIQELEKAKRRK